MLLPRTESRTGEESIRNSRSIVALALLMVVAFALRAASFRVSVIDWDESLYLVMVQRWLQGGLPSCPSGTSIPSDSPPCCWSLPGSAAMPFLPRRGVWAR
jgi:hypothetical protein